MGVSIFEGCGERCGYLAAVIAIFAWGSFGVPLKFAKTTQSTTTAAHLPSSEVNFFVMQSYKTCVCFFTCWVVLLMGEELRFSPWGLVSGLLWVPGASCGIYGIRNAGLALAVGTWSSIQVLISFLFGLIVFHEEVHSIQRATIAFSMLIGGLVGMARFAASTSELGVQSKEPPETTAIDDSLSSTERFTEELLTDRLLDSNSHVSDSGKLPPNDISIAVQPPVSGSVFRKNTAISAVVLPMDTQVQMQMQSSIETTARAATVNSNTKVSLGGGERVIHSTTRSFDKDKRNKDVITFCGGRIAMSKRQLGILGAAINGAWGGCYLIPLHYAKRDHGLSGAGYLISFATGSMIVNTAMWFLLFLYYYSNTSSSSKHPCRDAIEELPKWHLRELWWPGFLAGLLYSIGNFSSILAVTYLGQATGFSICQLQLFISGLWGVVWFREIRHPAVILRWFLSAACAICGIIWLSLEHKGVSVMEH